MRDIENDGIEDDGRVAEMLRAIGPDSVMDDLHFERVARQIGAAGGERLRRARVARRTVRAQWVGGVVSVGLAASAAFLLVFLHASPSQETGASELGSSAAVSTTGDVVREHRRELFAASVGEISEEDFLSNVGEPVDAETLLASSRE